MEQTHRPIKLNVLEFEKERDFNGEFKERKFEVEFEEEREVELQVLEEDLILQIFQWMKYHLLWCMKKWCLQ
ncbi:8553_t:CDS:2 [Gigaspora margarita]|uniref:8553_t:CDS:1 n=1 Tax=Gigaspora margarita TaxID=4874 RepID=A0ABN7V4H1_GIGMA|nr:8553_t:CDS:2 [Gigaspora margarita]